MNRDQLIAPKDYNIVMEVEKHAVNHPERKALIFHDEDGNTQEVTYGQLIRNVNRIGNAFLEQGLKKGDKVALVGFGTFSTAKRSARTGINPQTKKSIKIAAKTVAKFKAGSELASAVNGKKK